MKVPPDKVNAAQRHIISIEYCHNHIRVIKAKPGGRFPGRQYVKPNRRRMNMRARTVLNSAYSIRSSSLRDGHPAMDRTFSRPDKYHMKEIMMEKSNEPGDKAVKKTGASQADKAVKKKQTKKAPDKPKPAANKAMASGDQSPAKPSPGKQSDPKTAESAKDDSAKKKLTGEQVKAPEKEAEKTPSVKKESPSKQKADEKTAVKLTGKAEDAADTAKSTFSKKMDEVKEVASVIGQQIAKAANYVNDKSEIIEDAIEVGLHQMKKDIHRVAENIVEKTKE